MKITKTFLEKRIACRSQVHLFDSLFPEGTEVTEEACLKALGAGIDFVWACTELLNDQNAYNAAEKPLFDNYKAAIKPFLDAYNSANDALWMEYAEGTIVRSVYDSAENDLSDTYHAARYPLLDELNKQRALIFCKCFNEENP